MTTDRESIETFIYKYWAALERWRYADVLEMLTEDVEYVALVSSQGKSDVAAALQKRGTSLVVRHLITNLIIERSTDALKISYLLTAFGMLVTGGEKAPYPTAVPENIADVEMTLVEVDGILKVKRLFGRPIFRAIH